MVAQRSNRAIGTPKVAFVDSGVAANLLDADARSLLRPEGQFGPLLEGFVLMELARQLTWSRRRVELFHYRTKDGPAGVPGRSTNWICTACQRRAQWSLRC